MLVHFHIPKNAGTTIHELLKHSFRQRYYPCYQFYYQNQANITEPLSEKVFLKLLACLEKDVDIIGGHHLRPPNWQFSRSRNLQYFTFIRHPIDRIISLYHYERKWSEIKPEVYGENHPALQDFASYIRERVKENSAISNWQTYDLTGTFDGELARETLDNFLFVGLVEEWDLSLSLLQKKIKGLVEVKQQKFNICERKIVNKKSLDSNLFEKLLEMNREDLKLFLYAKKRLEIEAKSLRRN